MGKDILSLRRGLGRLSLCYFVLLAPNHRFTYISVIQIVTMVFTKLVTPVPRKMIVF
ncbi:hypothetical protein HMPREF0973_01647 [Prevotella veroralis F0319]|uniref:Uncharacterized protein n=1 Tax=Prevotella veroralis F0319 TaxID=649761 RepID=C9MPV1_9BACT|nr:hypothetical protein HMPREF0973_01647 [Prevotella veroralis F0319]